MKASLVFIISATSALLVSGQSFAADCSDYPYTAGEDIITVEGSEIPKILSTATRIPLDDTRTEEMSAIEMAQYEAEAAIVRFINQTITSESRMEEEVIKAAKRSGSNSELQTQTNIRLFKAIAKNANAVLTGVVRLGYCATPGKEVRVTVGLKPETVSAATGLSVGIAKAMDSRNAAAGAKDTNSVKTNPDTRKGVSDTERLKKF